LVLPLTLDIVPKNKADDPFQKTCIDAKSPAIHYTEPAEDNLLVKCVDQRDGEKEDSLLFDSTFEPNRLGDPKQPVDLQM